MTDTTSKHHENQHKHEDHHHDHHHEEQAHHEGHDHHDHGGHDHHGHHHHHGNFKELFLVSLIPALIIMIISPMMGIEFFFTWTFPYSDILAAVLATFLLVVGGRPFFQGAVDEFKAGQPSMMALVSMGLAVSYLYSLVAVILRYTQGIETMDFFFEFASLILIMLLGHWIEMEAVGKAGDAQTSLASLLPKEARLIQADGSLEQVPISQLEAGDKVQVQAGEAIPADGVITAGSSRVNESLLTGESEPVKKEVGDEVIGGASNGSNELEVEVRVTGQDTFISQVQSLVAQAQNQPSRAENLANKVASWLFYIALAAAILALIIWWLVEDFPTAIMYTVTTLVIACPHALGLAIPLVVARSTSIGAEHGILIKDREVYELAEKADVILLDKTGTLTTGDFKVLDIQSFKEDYSKADILSLLAGIEAGSSHPIAQSIINHAQENTIEGKTFSGLEVLAGKGVAGYYDSRYYQLISQKAYGKDLDIDWPTGASLSILLEEGQAIGAVALGDQVKESAHDLIDSLNEAGIQALMVTGDNEEAARAVAEDLGIDYLANQSPQDKHQVVDRLQKEGKQVIMLGDGVNDGPALALADVGIAIGAGTQVAIDSADVILTQSDPNDIQAFLELSHETQKKMKQNLAWGAGYNFLAIPLAAGILAPIGISLTPAMGAILMSASTVIVALNALSLNINSQ